MEELDWYLFTGCGTIFLLLFGNAIFYFGIRSKYVFIMVAGSCMIFLASLITFLMLVHSIWERNLFM